MQLYVVCWYLSTAAKEAAEEVKKHSVPVTSDLDPLNLLSNQTMQLINLQSTSSYTQYTMQYIPPLPKDSHIYSANEHSDSCCER